MKTLKDLKLEYQNDFGYYPEDGEDTQYLQWLEEYLLRELNKTEV